MEKNYIVSVGFFEDDGSSGLSEEKEYGPYSKEDAERMAAHLTEVGLQMRGGFKTFFIGASAVMLEPKGVEEIFAEIKTREEDFRGPLPTPAEVEEAKERIRLEKLQPPKPKRPRW